MLFPITNADKLACVKRELKLRREVYPRRIDAGKMSNDKAAWEIKVMEEIVRDYEAREKRPAG